MQKEWHSVIALFREELNLPFRPPGAGVETPDLHRLLVCLSELRKTPCFVFHFVFIHTPQSLSTFTEIPTPALLHLGILPFHPPVL